MKKVIKNKYSRTDTKVAKSGRIGRVIIDSKRLPLIDEQSIKYAEIWERDFYQQYLFKKPFEI